SSCSREVARTTQVTLRYLPWRLGLISTVAASKSGACLRTMPVTECTKRGSLRPITLIGKSQGKASGEPSATTGTGVLPLGPHLYLQRLALAGPHYLLLELLVELVHAAEHGARAAIADALAVELDDRQHLFRRRGDPDLVGGAHFGFGHVPEFERQAIGARELGDHVVGNARQDQVALRRRLDHAALDDEYVRRRRLGQSSVAEQDGFRRARFGRELAQQAVADERDRLDVAAQPAVVQRAHRAAALLHLRRRRVGERVGHHE